MITKMLKYIFLKLEIIIESESNMLKEKNVLRHNSTCFLC